MVLCKFSSTALVSSTDFGDLALFNPSTGLKFVADLRLDLLGLPFSTTSALLSSSLVGDSAIFKSLAGLIFEKELRVLVLDFSRSCPRSSLMGLFPAGLNFKADLRLLRLGLPFSNSKEFPSSISVGDLRFLNSRAGLIFSAEQPLGISGLCFCASDIVISSSVAGKLIFVNS